MKLFTWPVALLVSLLFYTSISASSWQYSINANMTCALNTQSQNYNGNSAGSFMWMAFLNPLFSRDFGTIRTDNELNIGFGQTRQKNEVTKKWSQPDITTDQLSFRSTLKFNTKSLKNTFAALDVNSQFVNNEEENNRRFFTPIELKESFGFYKNCLRKSGLSLNASVSGTLRQEFQHHAAQYDSNFVIRGFENRLIHDGGIELKSDILLMRNSWLTIASKVSLYQAFFRPQFSELYQNTWYYPDILWNSSFELNITSFLSFRYLFNFSYNRDASSKPFVKQTLGASFSFCHSGHSK